MFGDKARLEIERKFLVSAEWKPSGEGVRVIQGFLSIEKRATVRVRRVPERGVITVKGPTVGISREEFEYSIPSEDAERLLEGFCLGTVIDKVRYRIPHRGLVWEVDVFAGENSGLVLAELELESEDQPYEAPSWIGKEVSGDVRYFNSYLAVHPYGGWPDD